MKNVLITVMIFIVLALWASDIIATDILTFRLGVEFDHKAHQTEKVAICTVCHEERIGKIDGFGKEWAHRICINCHDLRNGGRPTLCSVCHRTMSQFVK